MVSIKQQIDQLNDSIYNAILEGKFNLLKADDDYISHGWLYSIQLHDSGNLKLDICVNHKDKLVYINNGPSILDLPNGTYQKQNQGFGGQKEETGGWNNGNNRTNREYMAEQIKISIKDIPVPPRQN